MHSNIASNIPTRLTTGFVVQGHIYILVISLSTFLSKREELNKWHSNRAVNTICQGEKTQQQMAVKGAAASHCQGGFSMQNVCVVNCVINESVLRPGQQSLRNTDSLVPVCRLC